MTESKYYRVKKDTFMWLEGAILKFDEDSGSEGGYTAISDLWDAADLDGEYISKRIIEAPENTVWFERVYEVKGLSKMVYMTKEKAREAVNKLFKEK